jgi:hypothetical protein
MSDVYAGLPRKVKVGAYTFRIHITTADKNDVLDGCDGITDFSKFHIYLDEHLARQRAINVVQHELTHAINWVYGIDDGALEEHITTQHTNGLVELWVSNPKVFNWIAKTLRAVKREAAKDDE